MLFIICLLYTSYDYDLSMDALVNYAQSSAGYDVCYILAAYSASMQQQNTGKDDMVSKLRGCAGDMFPVTAEEKEKEITIPVSYYTYKSVSYTHLDVYKRQDHLCESQRDRSRQNCGRCGCL